MYAALWRLIPGPLWARILVMVGLAAVVIAALMMFVFPAVNELVSNREVTVTP